MASERDSAIKKALDTALKDLSFRKGETKTLRKHEMLLGTEEPPTSGSSVPVWVQDGWSASEGSVRVEARQAGGDSHTVFVFLPRLEADELKETIGRFRAAEETVNARAAPQTSAGIEAKGAMQSRKDGQMQRVSDLVENIIRNARVYQGGGTEVNAKSFAEAIEKAVSTALIRLFPKFSVGDQTGWNRVMKWASQGDANPILALGYASDVDKHPVCKEVRSIVGSAGKKGSDVRRHFSDPPYGWPQDAIDGALLALLAAGFLRAKYTGESVTPKEMTQRQIGVTDFYIEGAVVTAVHRIGVRKVASAMGLPAISGEEASVIPRLLERLQTEAHSAGGEAPLPERPDTTILSELQETTGNRQIIAVAEQVETLIAHHRDWSAAGEAARKLLPDWCRLERFIHHAHNLPVATEMKRQCGAIRSQRTLLTEPNPLSPLLHQVTAALREALSEMHGCLLEEREREVAELEAWSGWERLDPQNRKRILESNELGPIPALKVGTDQALMLCLEETALRDWHNLRLALKTRIGQAREQAARLLAPAAVTFQPPSATLKSREEVEDYIGRLRKELLAQVEKRPVIIR